MRKSKPVRSLKLIHYQVTETESALLITITAHSQTVIMKQVQIAISALVVLVGTRLALTIVSAQEQPHPPPDSIVIGSLYDDNSCSTTASALIGMNLKTKTLTPIDGSRTYLSVKMDAKYSAFAYVHGDCRGIHFPAPGGQCASGGKHSAIRCVSFKDQF